MRKNRGDILMRLQDVEQEWIMNYLDLSQTLVIIDDGVKKEQ